MADDAKKDDKKADDGGAGGDVLARLKAACASLPTPIPIPDSAVSLEDVVLVMESYAMGKGDGSNADMNTDTDNDGDTTPAGSTNAAMLSTLAPEAREIVEAAQKKAAVVEARDRGTLLKRFKAVERPAVELGVAKPKELGDLERRLTGVNLSYSPEGELVTNAVMRELHWLETAVKAKKEGKAAPGKKIPNTQTVDLSSYGGGGKSLQSSTPQPGGPGWDEYVATVAARAGDRVAPKKN